MEKGKFKEKSTLRDLILELTRLLEEGGFTNDFLGILKNGIKKKKEGLNNKKVVWK